jgi:hypothetical protein
MTTAEDIEKAVEQLAPGELARFRAWFEAFDAKQFDAAIERDAHAGKLDAHAEEALAAHRAALARLVRHLPLPVRKLADANYELLKRDPRHPSLQFKKVGRYWSVRVGLRYRALAVEVDDGYLWFWIGSHAGYDKLIG